MKEIKVATNAPRYIKSNTSASTPNSTTAVVESGSKVKEILTENKGWGKKYSNLIRGLDSQNPQDRRKAETTLRVMNNQAKYVEDISKDAKLEATFTQNLGALVPKVIDLVRIFYPNLIAHDLVDIQPMDRQNGEVVIVQPEYNNSYVFTTFEYASGTDTIVGTTTDLQNQQVFKTYSDGNYASQNLAAVNAYTGATASTHNSATATVTVTRLDSLGVQLPVLAGSASIQFWITYSTAPYRIVLQDVSGNFTLQLVSVYDQYGNAASSTVFNAIQALITVGTVNSTTGLITVTFSSAVIPALLAGNQVNLWSATAEFDYQTQSAGINSLNLNLKVVPVTAQPHPLNVSWSVQAQLAAAAHLDLDIPDMLTNLVASFIKQERDTLLIKNIVSNATFDANLVFDATPSANYSRLGKYAEVELKLNYAESLIQQNQGRGGVSFVLCGTSASDIFRNAAGFEPSGIVAPIGPHKVGTLRDGTVAVIKVPKIMNPLTYVMGFKGYVVGDAATILAEWIPLFATPVFQAPSLNNSQGMMSLYALVNNNPGYYFRGSVINYSA